MVIYIAVILLHQIPAIRTINVAVYSAVQQSVFNLFHPSVRTDFALYSPTAKNADIYDFSVNIYSKSAWLSRHQGALSSAIVNQNAKLISIIPFAFLIGLVFASPSSWQRKLLGWAVAGLILLIYLALKYTYLIYNNAPGLTPDSFSIWVSLSHLLTPSFRAHEAMFLIIVGVWAITTLTLKDLSWFLK